METHETKSPAGTVALGRRFAQRLRPGDCVALTGPLGAGKTALVRGIAEGLGLAETRLVASPSFVLVREYAGTWPIYHVDLYRVSGAELQALGMEEMLADGVVVIEWADRAGEALPRPRWQIDLAPTGLRSRRLAIRRID